MPTAWDPAVRAALVARARTLTPQHTAKWGKFSVAGMLAHLNEASRMATGELPVTSKAPAMLKWPPLRYLIIHHLPMPKSAPTAPELIARSASAELARELALFEQTFSQLDGQSHGLVPHPAFGTLSHTDWGLLIHKHVDHHLRQFGG
ncbi:MAG: DUF1569 domain-containing protein [Devosia sp.]